MKKKLEYEGVYGEVNVNRGSFKQKCHCPISHEDKQRMVRCWHIQGYANGVHIVNDKVSNDTELPERLKLAESKVMEELKSVSVRKSSASKTDDLLKKLGYS